jgi:hypothetical protein
VKFYTSEGLASEQDDSRAAELMFAVLLTAEKNIQRSFHFFFGALEKIAKSDN